MKKPVNIIVALDKKFGISKNGVIPWFFKEDFDHFSKTTRNTNDKNKVNGVIMGSKTWFSIPDKFRGLGSRYNIILSNNMTSNDLDKSNITRSKAIIKKSLIEAVDFCNNEDNIENIYIGGGSSIYEESIKLGIVDECFITHIGDDYECDNFFPIEEWEKLCNKKCIRYRLTVLKESVDKNTKLLFTKSTLKYINSDETKYLELMEDIVVSGEQRITRNANTFSIFGPQLEFDLRKGFPLLTTKKMFWRGIVEELLFFLRGDTNSNHLKDKNIHIWDLNTTRDFLDKRNLQHYEVGDMGSMYGWNFRHFGAQYENMNSDYSGRGYDQLRSIIDMILNDPNSRRILMTTYDPSKIDECVLAPCHGIAIQFYISDGHMDCKMYQRSVDTFLGLPFNIASYALLLEILCKISGYKARRLIMTLGDTHIYEEHLEQVKKQIARIPYKFPNLSINKLPESNNLDDILAYIENLDFKDFELHDYVCYPVIKANMIA